MSLTTTRPEPTGPGSSGPSAEAPGSRFRSLGAEYLLAFAMVLMLNLVAGPTGYWSADEAVAHRQVDLLAEGRWTEPSPAPAVNPDIDPDGRWYPMNPVSLGDGVVGPYVKHPLFPFLIRVFEAPFGPMGRFLLPAVSAVAAAAIIGAGADRRVAGSRRTAFWASMVGTPLLFHGALLWAHAPAMALAGAWFLLLQRELPAVSPDPGTAPKPTARRQRPNLIDVGVLALHVLAIAAMVLLRSEAAIFTMVTGVTLLGAAVLSGRPIPLVGRLGARSSRLVVLGSTTIVVTLGAYLFDGVLRASILGPSGDVALSVPPEPLLDVEVRLGLLWRWLVGATPDNVLGFARIIGALLLAAATISARPTSRLTLSPAVGLIGGLLYVPAVVAESTISIAPAVPAVLVGLLLVRRVDPFTRLVLAVGGLHFGAVVATSYANGGGGDWGGRYLALLVAPAAMIGLAELHRSLADRSLRPLMLGTAVATVAIGAAISIDVVSARHDTTDLSDFLSGEVAARQDDVDLVVATDSRIGRLLGGEDLAVPMLQVPTDELDVLIQRLPPGSAIMVIDALDRVELPETWSVVDRTPSYVIATPTG